MDASEHIRIKDLPEDDKPREKMIRFGPSTLSDAELLAIIIGSGCQNTTAIELGRQIIRAFDDNLSAFVGISVEELQRHPALKGIGPAKACKIKAAVELGRRANNTHRDFPKVNGPREVARYLMHEMCHYREEHFVVLMLNTKNRIFKNEVISIGTINASLVHPREVFSRAIRDFAANVILAHNHPSGDPTPSMEDRQITERLISAGGIVGIPVLDHLIIGDQAYFSFKEEGLME